MIMSFLFLYNSSKLCKHYMIKTSIEVYGVNCQNFGNFVVENLILNSDDPHQSHVTYVECQFVLYYTRVRRRRLYLYVLMLS